MKISAQDNFQSGFVYYPSSIVKKRNTGLSASVKPDPQSNLGMNPLKEVSQTGKIQNHPGQEDPANEEKTYGQASLEKYPVNGQQLTPAEIRLLEELKQTDTEVRQHESAHIAAGGKYITSGANFTYQRGPDGKNYVVGGEVSIDSSPVPGDPRATLQKMRQVKNAALAPAHPSAQDLKVASKATLAATKAISDLMISKTEDQAASNENKAFGTNKKAINSYEKINHLTEKEPATFQTSV